MSTAEVGISPIRPATYNSYSTERKAEVLALVIANNGNVQKTAIETGIPEQTLVYWVKNADRYHEIRSEKELELAAKLDITAHKLANSIYDHDLDTATLPAKATAFGIVFDKLQLLRGQPTSITENAGDALTSLKHLNKQLTGTDLTDEQAREILDRSFKRLENGQNP